jgi:uncharacterized secreted protein with C-terminal beta-propeller domain
LDLDTNLLLAFAAVAVAIAAVIAYPYLEAVGAPPGASVQDFKEVPRFQSYADLKAAFDGAGSGMRNGLWEKMGGIAVPTSAADGSVAQSQESSTGFSTTNVQVEGVDEADIVKTDGRYIYNFSGENLVITDAYPIEGSKIVSETRLEGIYPLEMFVSGGKLVLFGGKYYEYRYGVPAGESGVAEGKIMPYPYYGGSRAVVRLYGISDRALPVLEKELEFDGEYLTSRLIGNYAYFVVNSWPSYRECDASNNEDCIIPLMAEDGVEKKIAGAAEIGYLPPMPAQSFVTLASIGLGNGALEKETIAGSAQGVFSSQENIYLEASVWIPREALLPEGTPAGEIERAVWGDTEETIVNKFGLAEGKIGFLGQGRVPGRVLNQFSMDEYGGNFRIATTIGRNGSNCLFVLNKDMETIGKLEGLAPGESIYSARFMGSRAYLVTFKKTDPLFAIDLSNPEAPMVLGKLKIPGYSDYLHPMDETHIIGIGKDTIESAKGDFAWYQGLKMAIFDVSDVEHPVEMHKIVIGDRGTDSYALHDHKAFLFDGEKGLLVLPITLAEIPESDKEPLDDGQDWPSYGEYVFQGAFVFKVNLEEGFVERGRITHITPEEELKRGYYFGEDYSVKRALYIGNVLYTLSGKMLKANDLSSLEGLKEFVFG